MARRFQYEGVTWEVALTGPGTLGCSLRRVEVTFTSPSQGRALTGRITMAGEGRLTDDELTRALAEALADRDSDIPPRLVTDGN
jgi:hypothetical protein